MTLWVLTGPTVVTVGVLEVLTNCCPDENAILTLEFDLTDTGIVVPGLMLEGKIGVLTVTSWVLGLEDGCNETNNWSAKNRNKLTASQWQG